MNQTHEAISCMRAGLLIVILSGLGLSLLQPLEVHLTMKYLGRYIAERHALATQLDDLDHNPCWEGLQKTSMSLATMSQSDCLKNRKPGANGAQEVIQLLSRLTDSALLEKARMANYDADFSLYRWKVRSNTMFESVGNIGTLSFGSAKELSAFEFPEMSKYDASFRNYQLLHTQWTPLTIRLTHAGTICALGMIVAMAYFWLFFVEATRSGNSNREGTIFTAIRRTQFSRVLFFVFLVLPPFVIGLLLVKSYPVSEGPTNIWDTSNPVLDLILWIGVIVMSVLIWRIAQSEWYRTERSAAG